MDKLLFGTLYFKRLPVDQSEIVEFYRNRKSLLDAHGVDTKFLASRIRLPRPFVNTGEILRMENPEMTLRIPYYGISPDAYSQIIKWPRDSFNIFGKTAYVPVEYYPMQDVLERQNPKLEFVISPIGEQGRSIRIDDMVLYAPLKNVDWKALEKHNVRVIPAHYPIAWKSSIMELLLFHGMRPNQHIDPLINGFSYNGTTAIFVTRDYDIMFHNTVDKVTRKFGFHKEVITSRKDLKVCGVNFFQLPDGAVAVPKDADQTIDMLAKYLPDDKIIPLPILADECIRYEGLRCKTNIIPDPKS